MANNEQHAIELARSKSALTGGDLLFLISCSEIISKSDRDRYQKTLVIHASDLPRGRGWSPHVWQLIAGQEEITVTLLEAEDRVDSGDIWHQVRLHIPKHALWDEINTVLFAAELQLMDFAVANFGLIQPRPQASDLKPTYYPKRTPNDSELDPDVTISSQFDLIRVCDPARFPAFIRLRGQRYRITVEKIDDV